MNTMTTSSMPSPSSASCFSPSRTFTTTTCRSVWAASSRTRAASVPQRAWLSAWARDSPSPQRTPPSSPSSMPSWPAALGPVRTGSGATRGGHPTRRAAHTGPRRIQTLSPQSAAVGGETASWDPGTRKIGTRDLWANRPTWTGASRIAGSATALPYRRERAPF